jgi:hypothetical protein
VRETTLQDSLLSGKTRALLDVWRAARPDGAPMPFKKRVDPLALGAAGILAHAWLVEREPDTGRFRYRVSGDEIDAVFGRGMTGRYADETFTRDTIGPITDLWTRMLDEGLIFHSAGDLMAPGKLKVPGERLVFPLMDTDGSPRFILGVTDYDYFGHLIGNDTSGSRKWVTRRVVPVGEREAH